MNWESLVEGDVVVTKSSTYVILSYDQSNDLLHALYIEESRVIGIRPSKLFRLNSKSESVYRGKEQLL